MTEDHEDHLAPYLGRNIPRRTEPSKRHDRAIVFETDGETQTLDILVATSIVLSYT
jgi:hypothetical protein